MNEQPAAPQPSAAPADAGGRARAVVADAALPRVLAREYVAWTLSRPAWITLWVVAGVLAAAAVVLTIATGDPFALVLVAVWLVLLGVIAAVVYAMTRSSAARAFAPGSPFGAGFDGATLSLTSAVGRSELDLSVVRRVDTSAHAVFLRLSTARGAVAILPREAFAPVELERLRTAVSRG
ncbi:YcxB family protein [Microbacterium telephonicum]|uniref:YcxB-like protein n=1 Tax=Microbacterium telephonicum TaxID=1714841 RepID=A0A498BUR1_9MICO|nr:YcxB family protein [Microbacterium telephonicum]RLK46647.1 hypothetical protein C7474_2832 [Microbacterium telephonicum]